MIKVFQIFLLVLFVQNVSGQYEGLDYKVFISLDALDETIELDENFNYNLLQYAVLHYTNKHRLENRKAVLTYNQILQNSALLHSNQMKKYDFFDHINKRERSFRDLDDRADFVAYNNYMELAENLYYGFVELKNLPSYRTLAQTIVNALIDSKSHNLNLINKDLKEMGAAIVFKSKSENGFLHYYVTQSFGTKFP